MSIKKNFFAPSSKGLGATRRAAMLLAIMLTAAQGAWAWDGSGTAESPYQIKSTADLDQLATDVNNGTTYENKYFVLTADIAYDHTNLGFTESNYEAIGDHNHYFRGHFDGNSKTISGIRIYKGGTAFADYYQGLFGQIDNGAEVKSVILADTRITGPNYTGAIVGCNNGGTVTDCHALADVTVHAVKTYVYYHGGIAGANYGTVTRCTSAAALTTPGSGPYYVGGIVGHNNSNGTVTDCIYLGTTLDGASDVGAIVGQNDSNGTVETCYYTDTAIQGKDYTGTTLGNAASAVGINNGGNVTDVRLATSDDFAVSGDTYTIGSTAGWSVMCAALYHNDTFNRFSGKTVLLGADITVTRMAGGQPFTGTFDGAGHTLTVQYGTPSEPVNQQFVAPFVEVADAAKFTDLTIAGSIHAAYTGSAEPGVGGLIGHLFGGVTIEGCTSTVEITSTRDRVGGFVGLCEHSVSFTDCVSSAVVHYSRAGNISGFVGWSRASEYTISFEGCLFNGKLLLDNGQWYGGGFVGWKGDGKTVNITNCLYAPPIAADEKYESGGATFCSQHDDKNPAVITNGYYTHTLGTAQGNATHTVTAGTDVTIDAIALTGDATEYNVSGITAYSGGGLQRGQTLYYGSDDQLSLTLSNTATGAPDGYQYGYTTNAGTLSGTTLTMPDENVTISVNTAELAPIDWATVNQGDSAEDPYMIYNKDQLLLLAHRVNGTNDETANTYQGKFFKLGADITFSHPDNEGDEYDENYEAIGVYNGTTRYFNGTFDGDGYTVSGIRIRKTGSGIDCIYQGLFGLTGSVANIHDVHLTDARITGYVYVGGIIAYNTGAGSVSGCSVTDSYITATHNRNYGTICGTNTTGTLTNNYYHGCTVNGTAVTSGMGCNGADVTANNGAVSIHTLTLAEGITTSTPVTVTIGTTGYYAQGTAITLSAPLGYRYDGYTAYTASAGTLSGTTLTMPDEDVTISVNTAAILSTGQPVTVAYIKADGTTGEASAIALDGHEAVGEDDFVHLAAGTYYVGTDITYANQIRPDGDVTLILADRKTMTLASDVTGIEGGYLTIYGQSLDYATAGTLRYDGTSVGIYANNYEQHSGNVSITTTGYGVRGINASVTLRGGTLTISANGYTARAIYGYTHSILGGQLTATATGTAPIGIYAFAYSGTALTLGWTRPADCITASSISAPDDGTVAVATGQALTDGSGHIYTGTLTAADRDALAALNGKTLQPCLALANAADNTAAIDDHADQPLAVALAGRTLYKDGSWNTLCLPFDVTVGSGQMAGATAMTLNGSTSGFDSTSGVLTLNFDGVGEGSTIAAGTPFIAKWTGEDVSSPVFSGVTVSNGNNDVSFNGGAFKGSYSYMEWAAGMEYKSILLLGANSKLFWPNGENVSRLGACRAYFELSDGVSAREFVLNFGDDEATGIISIHNSQCTIHNEAGAWYTLDGRKLDGQPTAKGLYIHGGKKVGIK